MFYLSITCVCIIYVCGHLTKGQKALVYFLIMMGFIQIVEKTVYQSVSVQRGDKKKCSNLNRKSLIQIMTKFNVELPIKGKNNFKEYSDGRTGSSPQL